MAVLVTGGTGFIGSFVVRSLLEIGEMPVVLDIGEIGDPLRDFIGKNDFLRKCYSSYKQLIKEAGIYKIERK